MKTLFKLTFLAFVLAIMTPIAFFAWRMGQPMDAPEFKGLTYYQYSTWIREEYDKAWKDVDMEAYRVKHPNSGLDADACANVDFVLHGASVFSLGLDMILANILGDEPFPAHPLLTWWQRFEAIQVGLLDNAGGYPACRIPDSISDDYALSVGAKLPSENGAQ